MSPIRVNPLTEKNSSASRSSTAYVYRRHPIESAQSNAAARLAMITKEVDLRSSSRAAHARQQSVQLILTANAASLYQNDADGRAMFNPSPAIANRLGGFERGLSPPESEKLTCFIDIGQTLLWWVVCAWSQDFGCSIVDYGSWPQQTARVFLARNASPTLSEHYPHAGGIEGFVYAGLSDLVGRLASREWRRSDGARIPLVRVLLDSGWMSETVRLFIRQSPHRDLLIPAKGVGIGPGQTAIADYHRRSGERIGDGWILGIAGADRLRLLRFDANFYKSRIAEMLTRPMGEQGGIVLWGDKPHEHENLALHLSAEYPTRTEAKGNVVNVWARRADRDNHMLDAVCGCAVAASLEGLSPLTALGASTKPAIGARKRVSFSAMQRAAQHRR
jgi:hypothetical protein